MIEPVQYSILTTLEKKVYELSSKLNGALNELSEAATKINGQPLVADLCGGDEIEFRRLDKDGIPNDYDCIRIEDIKKAHK